MRKFTHISALAVLAATGLAMPALAQNTDIADIAISLKDQGVSVSTLLSVAAFVMGLGLAAGGLFKLAKGSEGRHDPQNKSSTGWVMIFAGAAMVALPSVIGSGVATIFGNTDGVISITAPSAMINVD